MPIDVTDNYVRIRQRDPGDFQKNTLRTITFDKARGIKAVVGRLKGKTTTTVQTLLLPTDKFTKAQAIKWARSHDFKASEEAEMETTIALQEEKWTRAFINDLDDSDFLYIEKGGKKDDAGRTVPRSLRHFPVSVHGKPDKAHIRSALQRIPQSDLSDSIKKQATAKARALARKQGINVSDEFLDPVNLRFPISQPHLLETLIRFNSGEPHFFDYTAEQMDYMGRKLARELNKSTWISTSDRQYDENGEVISTSGTDSNQSEDRCEYQDGQIIITKSKSDGSRETTWEYSNGGGGMMGDMSNMGEDDENADDELALAEDDQDISIFEAYSTGDMIKAMRTKKKMSRTDMAANMNMSKARLTEIEDGVDEPDDAELADIAGALGMTMKRMQKMMDAMIGGDNEDQVSSEETIEVYEVIGEPEGVYDIVEIADNVIESGKNIFTKESYESREFRGMTEECHKIYGRFVSESITKNKDGSITFRVPIFKFGELTSNGNRYMEECGQNLKKHLSRINQKNSKLETVDENKKTPIDIEVANYLDGRSLDMLATHRGRLGEGNPLLERAGRIIGGEIGQIEGDKAFFLIGETLSKYPGDAITEQITKGMIRGVSLFGIPTKFEENNDGGSDVYDMQLVGADFTDDGGNLIQFRDKKNASFAVLN